MGVSRQLLVLYAILSIFILFILKKLVYSVHKYKQCTIADWRSSANDRSQKAMDISYYTSQQSNTCGVSNTRLYFILKSTDTASICRPSNVSLVLLSSVFKDWRLNNASPRTSLLAMGYDHQQQQHIACSNTSGSRCISSWGMGSSSNNNNSIQPHRLPYK